MRNQVLGSLLLAFGMTAASQEDDPPQAPMMPHTICLLQADGQATLYRNTQEREGVYDPDFKSAGPVKSKVGFIRGALNIIWDTSVTPQQGLTGQYEAPAYAMKDHKALAWSATPEATIEVQIKKYDPESKSVEGRCVAKGAYELAGPIMSGKSFVPVMQSSPVIKHVTVSFSDWGIAPYATGYTR